MEVSRVTNPMPPAPLPQYKVGDKFVFDAGVVNDVQTVVSVNETQVTMKSNVFGTLTQYKDFGNPGNWPVA
jgi:hypothetical protein